ncbi:transcription factor hamlet isoform X2 [Hyalella azteca]|uniref:Transcription factor hamlet isoform X2 n=1 Tax=Hyalella azteca TaxID=294128 RepID=A0A979FYG1_HYAAZ|nr:transcription factor hamlet isoform X2 [Hyalella azteca]
MTSLLQVGVASTSVGPGDEVTGGPSNFRDLCGEVSDDASAPHEDSSSPRSLSPSTPPLNTAPSSPPSRLTQEFPLKEDNSRKIFIDEYMETNKFPKLITKFSRKNKHDESFTINSNNLHPYAEDISSSTDINKIEYSVEALRSKPVKKLNNSHEVSDCRVTDLKLNVKEEKEIGDFSLKVSPAEKILTISPEKKELDETNVKNDKSTVKPGCDLINEASGQHEKDRIETKHSIESKIKDEVDIKTEQNMDESHYDFKKESISAITLNHSHTTAGTLHRLMTDQANVVHNSGPFGDIHTLMNKMNHLNGMSISHLLARDFLNRKNSSGHDIQNASTSTPSTLTISSPSASTGNNCFSTSMVTLSPPHTLSPHNRSNNLSISPASASPQDNDADSGADDHDDDDDPVNTYYKNNQKFRSQQQRSSDKRPRFDSKVFFPGQNSPPLTPQTTMNGRSQAAIDKTKNKFNLAYGKDDASIDVFPRQEYPSRITVAPSSFFNSVSFSPMNILGMNLISPSAGDKNDHSVDIHNENNHADKHEPFLDKNIDQFGNQAASKMKDNTQDDKKIALPGDAEKNSYHKFPESSTSYPIPDSSLPNETQTSELNAATERLITQQLSIPPAELQVKEKTSFNYKQTNAVFYSSSDQSRDKEVRGGCDSVSGDLETSLDDFSGRGTKLAIFAKFSVAKGARYGPFMGKFTAEAKDPSFAWQVMSSRTGERGWLDAREFGNWLRLVAVADSATSANLKHVLLNRKIFYEASRDIAPGEELLLARKTVVDLDTSYTESSDHRNEVTTNAAGGACDSELAEDDVDDNGISHRCLQCDKNFKDYDSLDEHLIASHGFPANQHRCKYCPRAFAWRPSLIQHNIIHGEFKRYPCENCSRVFTDSSVLQKHIRTQHVGARAYACAECGKTFATSSGLKQHTHIHSSVKPYVCESCFKAYTQFSNLCRHKRMHADCRQQVKCSKCNQTFPNSTHLSKHKRFCDTAPTTPMQAGLAPMNEFNKLPPSNYGMRSLQVSPPSSLAMYPRPPIPLLHQSILGNYPMFSNFPSLVGGPQHPLITPSMFLPLHGNTRRHKREMHDQHDSGISLGEESDREFRGAGPRIESSLTLEQSRCGDVQTLDDEASSRARSRSPLFSSQQESPSPGKESTHESEDSMDQSKTQSDVEDSMMTSPRRLSPSPNSNEFEPKPKLPGGRKESTPLDLTVRREEMDLISNNKIASSSSQSDISKDKSPVKENPQPRNFEHRSGHPLWSISDLLKEPTPKTPPTLPAPPTSLVDTPTKFNLAYPRPLHPNYIFDMCRNFERNNQERAHLLPPSASPRSYPLMPFFSASAMSGMGGLGLGLGRSPNLDLFKAQMTASSRPYPDLSRTYDLMPAHIPRPKDRYSCKFCGKVFPRSANLTRHLRTHTGEQPYKCKHCERSFSISSNLQRHVRNIHNKERPFRCPLCSRSFGQQTNLDRHLKHHEEGGPDIPDVNNVNETPVKFLSDEIRSFVYKVTDQGNDDSVVDDLDEDEEDEEEINKSFHAITDAGFTNNDSL